MMKWGWATAQNASKLMAWSRAFCGEYSSRWWELLMPVHRMHNSAHILFHEPASYYQHHRCGGTSVHIAICWLINSNSLQQPRLTTCVSHIPSVACFIELSIWDAHEINVDFETQFVFPDQAAVGDTELRITDTNVPFQISHNHTHNI